MWSNDIRNNLAKELEEQLDNKKFFDAKAYYSSINENSNMVEEKKSSFMMPNSVQKSSFSLNEGQVDYTVAVKGMSFASKKEVENNYYDSAMSFKGKKEENKQINSIDNLSQEERKIYKMKDIINADLAETIVFPIKRDSVPITSLALIKRPNWKELLFTDVSEVWNMIKNKFENK